MEAPSRYQDLLQLDLFCSGDGDSEPNVCGKRHRNGSAQRGYLKMKFEASGHSFDQGDNDGDLCMRSDRAMKPPHVSAAVVGTPADCNGPVGHVTEASAASAALPGDTDNNAQALQLVSVAQVDAPNAESPVASGILPGLKLPVGVPITDCDLLPIALTKANNVGERKRKLEETQQEQEWEGGAMEDDSEDDGAQEERMVQRDRDHGGQQKPKEWVALAEEEHGKEGLGDGKMEAGHGPESEDSGQVQIEQSEAAGIKALDKDRGKMQRLRKRLSLTVEKQQAPTPTTYMRKRLLSCPPPRAAALLAVARIAGHGGSQTAAGKAADCTGGDDPRCACGVVYRDRPGQPNGFFARGSRTYTCYKCCLRNKKATGFYGPPGTRSLEEAGGRACEECGATQARSWHAHKITLGVYVCNRCDGHFKRDGTYKVADPAVASQSTGGHDGGGQQTLEVKHLGVKRSPGRNWCSRALPDDLPDEAKGQLSLQQTKDDQKLEEPLEQKRCKKGRPRKHGLQTPPTQQVQTGAQEQQEQPLPLLLPEGLGNQQNRRGCDASTAEQVRMAPRSRAALRPLITRTQKRRAAGWSRSGDLTCTRTESLRPQDDSALAEPQAGGCRYDNGGGDRVSDGGGRSDSDGGTASSSSQVTSEVDADCVPIATLLMSTDPSAQQAKNRKVQVPNALPQGHGTGGGNDVHACGGHTPVGADMSVRMPAQQRHMHWTKKRSVAAFAEPRVGRRRGPSLELRPVVTGADPGLAKQAQKQREHSQQHKHQLPKQNTLKSQPPASSADQQQHQQQRPLRQEAPAEGRPQLLQPQEQQQQQQQPHANPRLRCITCDTPCTAHPRGPGSGFFARGSQAYTCDVCCRRNKKMNGFYGPVGTRSLKEAGGRVCTRCGVTSNQDWRFDPEHWGHYLCNRCAAKKFQLRRIAPAQQRDQLPKQDEQDGKGDCGNIVQQPERDLTADDVVAVVQPAEAQQQGDDQKHGQAIDPERKLQLGKPRQGTVRCAKCGLSSSPSWYAYKRKPGLVTCKSCYEHQLKHGTCARTQSTPALRDAPKLGAMEVAAAETRAVEGFEEGTSLRVDGDVAVAFAVGRRRQRDDGGAAATDLLPERPLQQRRIATLPVSAAPRAIQVSNLENLATAVATGTKTMSPLPQPRDREGEHPDQRVVSAWIQQLADKTTALCEACERLLQKRMRMEGCTARQQETLQIVQPLASSPRILPSPSWQQQLPQPQQSMQPSAVSAKPTVAVVELNDVAAVVSDKTPAIAANAVTPDTASDAALGMATALAAIETDVLAAPDAVAVVVPDTAAGAALADKVAMTAPQLQDTIGHSPTSPCTNQALRLTDLIYRWMEVHIWPRPLALMLGPVAAALALDREGPIPGMSEEQQYKWDLSRSDACEGFVDIADAAMGERPREPVTDAGIRRFREVASHLAAGLAAQLASHGVVGSGGATAATATAGSGSSAILLETGPLTSGPLRPLMLAVAAEGLRLALRLGMGAGGPGQLVARTRTESSMTAVLGTGASQQIRPSDARSGGFTAAVVTTRMVPMATTTEEVDKYAHGDRGGEAVTQSAAAAPMPVLVERSLPVDVSGSGGSGTLDDGVNVRCSSPTGAALLCPLPVCDCGATSAATAITAAVPVAAMNTVAAGGTATSPVEHYETPSGAAAAPASGLAAINVASWWANVPGVCWRRRAPGHGGRGMEVLQDTILPALLHPACCTSRAVVLPLQSPLLLLL